MASLPLLVNTFAIFHNEETRCEAEQLGPRGQQLAQGLALLVNRSAFFHIRLLSVGGRPEEGPAAPPPVMPAFEPVPGIGRRVPFLAQGNPLVRPCRGAGGYTDCCHALWR